MAYAFPPLNSPAPVYALPKELPWGSFAGALEPAEEGLAQLEECLTGSGLSEDWIARGHFGELVHLKDLVLPDAYMGVRMATHGTARAMAGLRCGPNAWPSDGRRAGSDHPLASMR